MAFVESNLNRFNSASNAMAQTEDAIQRRKQLNAERTANFNENIMEAGGNIADILSKRKENETQRRFEGDEAAAERYTRYDLDRLRYERDLELERLGYGHNLDIERLRGDEAAADRYTNYDLERLRYEYNLAIQNAADRAAQQRLQFGDDSNISNLSDLFWTAYPGAAQAMGVWDMAAGDTTEEFDWSDSAAVASMKLKFMSLIANQSDEDKKALEAIFDSMVADRAAGREPELPINPVSSRNGAVGYTYSGVRPQDPRYTESLTNPLGGPAVYPSRESMAMSETGVYVPTEQTQPAPVPEKKKGFLQGVVNLFGGSPRRTRNGTGSF